MISQSKRLLLAWSICVTTLLSAGSADAYVQLIDLPTLTGGDGSGLISGTIDGTTGYAVLSASGGQLHRIVKIEDLGQSNIVTTLVSNSAWNSIVDPGMLGAPSGISGVPFISGGSLLIADVVTDQVVSINTTTGAATLLVDAATVGGPVLFAGLNQGTGNLLVYRTGTTTASLFQTTGAVNGFDLVLDAAGLTTVTGDTGPTGVTADSNGVIYMGQGTATAGENIYFYNPTDMSNGVLATEADIVGAGDVGFSNTAFNLLGDGVLYFSDNGTNDAFRSIDPSVGPASIREVIGETLLVAGPANSDFASSFSLYNGNLAWVQTISAGGQLPGFYAIPEPSTVIMLAGLLGGFALYRRR